MFLHSPCAYCACRADRLLEDFRVLNNSVENSGVFTEMASGAENCPLVDWLMGG
jgi:hypothetical protein